MSTQIYIVKREPESVEVRDRKMTQVRQATIRGKEWRFVTLHDTWIGECVETGEILSARSDIKNLLARIVGAPVESERGW